jgi:hypothetical protein
MHVSYIYIYSFMIDHVHQISQEITSLHHG